MLIRVATGLPRRVRQTSSRSGRRGWCSPRPGMGRRGSRWSRSRRDRRPAARRGGGRRSSKSLAARRSRSSKVPLLRVTDHVRARVTSPVDAGCRRPDPAADGGRGGRRDSAEEGSLSLAVRSPWTVRYSRAWRVDRNGRPPSRSSKGSASMDVRSGRRNGPLTTMAGRFS